VKDSTVQKFAFCVAGTALTIAGPVSAQPAAGSAPAKAIPGLAVHLKPIADAQGRISTLDVELGFETFEAADPRRALRMPIIYANVVTSANAMTQFEARDANGPLRVTIEDDPREPLWHYRNWGFDRRPTGPVTVRYRLAISNELAPLGTAPPLELRNDSAALSGMGTSFLTLPQGENSYRLSVDWDLSALPAGSQAFSSFGEGRASLAEPAPASRFAQTYFMAGKVSGYPSPAPAQGFFSVWQGQTGFDSRELMGWTETMFKEFSGFFRDPELPRYGVFMRRNQVNPGGGAAMPQSFVVTYDKGTDVPDLKLTLAHEMLHSWNIGLDTPADTQAGWYTEGAAVVYARRLPLRFGLITPDDFLRDLNMFAGRYYTNALASTPNKDLPARYWEETRVRTLAYDRGSLYLNTVDDMIRKASRGARSLDDAIFAMMERRRAHPIGPADWEAVLQEQLGSGGKAAVKQFREMLAGGIVLPASDAFGPCFKRVQRPLRRYQLGFESKVLIEPERIIRNLVPGSNAERAGLLNGDRILVPIGQDAIQGDQDRQLTLQIRRGGQNFPITYLPRGETVMAYQWERIAGVPDQKCAL